VCRAAEGVAAVWLHAVWLRSSCSPAHAEMPNVLEATAENDSSSCGVARRPEPYGVRRSAGWDTAYKYL
jgi:hypothetical protein